MHRFARRILIVPALLVAAALVTQAQRNRITINDVGLPPLDTGVLLAARAAPGTSAARVKKAVEAAIRNEDPNESTHRAAPGRVVVRFRTDASAARRAAAVRAVVPSGVIAPRPTFADFDIVRIAATDDPETVAASLRARHGDVVLNAQAVYRWRTMLTPNDALYSTRQWNFPMLNLEPAWDIQPAAGSDIIVAVIDTGMAYRSATITANLPAFELDDVAYPALGPQTIPYAAANQLVDASRQTRIVAPYDFIWDDDTPLDFDGHGTHVSGTVGQITNDATGTAGVAFNVRLMPIKVIDSLWDFLFGAPNFATDDVVARGIRYAADRGAKVLNLSIGRSGPPAFVVEDAIRYAVSRGVFVAVASGNMFAEGNPISVLAEICSRVDGAVSVGAIDRNRAHAPYSSAGAYLELAAPGGNATTPGFAAADGFIFQQTFNFLETDTFLLAPAQFRPPRFDILGYIGYVGTSMASPHVAGAAALLMQQGITSPAAIEDALKRTAVDLGTPGRDNFFGHGLVNVRNAMFGIGAAR
jgi:serine protease